jgi:hypothetical protein
MLIGYVLGFTSAYVVSVVAGLIWAAGCRVQVQKEKVR